MAPASFQGLDADGMIESSQLIYDNPSLSCILCQREKKGQMSLGRHHQSFGNSDVPLR
jgi:hypothetical protein